MVRKAAFIVVNHSSRRRPVESDQAAGELRGGLFGWFSSVAVTFEIVGAVRNPGVVVRVSGRFPNSHHP